LLTPIPEWYFLFYYEMLKYFRGPWEIVGTVVIPVLFYALLFLLPFLDRWPERRPFSRPIVIGAGGLLPTVVFIFLFISLRTVVKMPVTDPSVVRGKQLYQTLGCAACHRIHGEGEMIGPELSSVGAQRDADWLIRRLKGPESVALGSIMTAFAGLSETELTDLTTYPMTLK
jgi:mono/diheme cytochrome c family protein